ncbi:hypothetical protein MLD63_13460 [Paracoccus sp. TK19116]|uniref:Uncharacterized protein n=1 Tax=Paracoccus albicereus TaxID=2922394 RepID=A0ABT1MSY1_9RHOB|nr:hypothetical protein [Paracoccus albicereus]MCQ0971428.1 hypothetical protein [Paracoccus albicereus]
MREIAVPQSRRGSITPSLLTGLAALADAALMKAWLAGELPMVGVIAVHLIVSVAFGACYHVTCGRSVSKSLANTAVLVLIGPLGGAALMLIGSASVGARADVTHERQSYSVTRLSRDPAELLYDQIRQGRRHKLHHGTVESFMKTFDGAPLSQQQEAIAAISREYHPDLRPALAAALASPVPALRVQAAAVYAKLRGSYGDRAKAMLTKGERCAKSEIMDVADSGFVDEDTRAKLLELVEEIEPSSPLPSLHRALDSMPRLKRYSCGGLA